GAYDTDGKGAVDAAPPRAVRSIVADQNEENEAQEKLGDANEVEELGIAEN
ncbi:MAG: hypothetical protein Q9168_004691, partial [Polycauliona sp. 1 TL-2023]